MFDCLLDQFTMHVWQIGHISVDLGSTPSQKRVSENEDEGGGVKWHIEFGLPYCALFHHSGLQRHEAIAQEERLVARLYLSLHRKRRV